MGSWISPRIRQVVLAAVALLALVVLAGATVQGVATALERRTFHHPGRLVDVGGHQLHIYCVGNGSPVVVLEAAAAGISTGWGWVQHEIGRTTRVCSYDRAGLGWSEAGERDYDPSRVPEELNTLLERSGEHGPFVVVGHEIGAAFVRLYATQYPDRVAALVLVDDPSQSSGTSLGGTRFVRAWPWLARLGLLRVVRLLSARAHGLPPASAGPTRAFLNRPDHLTRGAREIIGSRTTVARALQAEVHPSLPVEQVTTGSQTPPAILASADAARPVTRAIEKAIATVRP